MKERYSIVTIDTWESFISFISEMDDDIWIYRGQKDNSWELKTSLERAADDYKIELTKLPKIEQGMIRKYHRHLRNNNVLRYEKSDYFEIMSLMQHHGSPTRFLDFSHSPYIGIFFAIIDASICNDNKKAYASVWAINSKWLDERYRYYSSPKYNQLLLNDPYEKSQEIMKAILNERKACIKHVGPYEMNERLIIQQGTFLIPLDLTKTFMTNLCYSYEEKELIKNIIRIDIECSKNFIDNAYKQLYRMNISRATLFPGIDGFSMHLKMLMLLPNTISSDCEDFA